MATCPACRKRYPDDVVTCEVDGETLLPNEAFTGVDADLSNGQLVGEYRIEGKIGEGGFGSVYKAVHPLIGKTAAVKVLNRQYSANPQMVSRFIAEARAVNQIRHRNIIDIFAFGSLEDGRQYFIMELLQGLPLDKYLEERGRLAVDETVSILRPVARALDAAHAAGIAHRDLKPENIFVGFDEDGVPFPKLLDFGIAKLLTPDQTHGQTAKTRTGTPMGTPYYMSPEQCRGKNVDHRTDIYSFGIMLHQLLAGRLPFDGEDLMDLLIKQSSAPAPPLSSVAPDLPPALDAPILSMLEKDPARRPASVGAAMDAFLGAAQGVGFSTTFAGRASTRSALARSAPLASAHRITPGPASPSGLPPNATPDDLRMLGAAKTALTPIHAQTFQGAGLDVADPAARRRRSVVPLVLAPIVLLLGAAGVFVALRKPAPDAKPVVVAQGVATPPASAAPPATAAPPVVATVPPQPADVLVTVHATPDAASIWLGADKLGAAPGPVKLPRGDGKVKLTIKSDGYAPSDVEIEPTENVVVSVKLTKAAASRQAQQPKRPSGDLENPF